MDIPTLSCIPSQCPNLFLPKQECMHSFPNMPLAATSLHSESSYSSARVQGIAVGMSPLIPFPAGRYFEVRVDRVREAGRVAARSQALKTSSFKCPSLHSLTALTLHCLTNTVTWFNMGWSSQAERCFAFVTIEHWDLQIKVASPFLYNSFRDSHM